VAADASRRARRLGPAEYQALAGFRHALRRFLAFSESAARAVGLSPRQHQALLAVKGAPPGGRLTIGDLAATLGVRHHSAVGLVDRLAALGLLARRTDARDRRRIHLALTGRGARRLAGLAAVHRLELRRLRPELEALLRSLGPAASPRARRPPSRSRG
jgi:DNA-binding MarR family transcriptional regulator